MGLSSAVREPVVYPNAKILQTFACSTSCLVPVIVTLPFAPGTWVFSLEQDTLAPVVLVMNFKLSPPRPAHSYTEPQNFFNRFHVQIWSSSQPERQRLTYHVMSFHCLTTRGHFWPSCSSQKSQLGIHGTNQSGFAKVKHIQIFSNWQKIKTKKSQMSSVDLK